MDDDDEFLRATLGAMDLVYNIARKTMPTAEDARDLVQDTYLAAFAAWRQHRRPRKVEPWLATICLNLARSAYRRRARRPAEVPWEEGRPAASIDPEDAALSELDRAALRRAMWSISEDQRIAIALGPRGVHDQGGGSHRGRTQRHHPVAPASWQKGPRPAPLRSGPGGRSMIRLFRRRPSHDPERDAAAYVSGELAGQARASFKEHLVDCEYCWSEVRLGRLGRRLAEATRELAPSELREDVRAAVATAPRPTARMRHRLVAGGAISVVLAILVGAVLVHGGGQPGPIAAALANFRSGAPPSIRAERPAPDLSAGGLLLDSGGRTSLHGLPVDEFLYLGESGARVVVFLSDRPFPPAAGATARSGSLDGWAARDGDLTMLCGSRPVSYLLIGDDALIAHRVERVLRSPRALVVG